MMRTRLGFMLLLAMACGGEGESPSEGPSAANEAQEQDVQEVTAEGEPARPPATPDEGESGTDEGAEESNEERAAEGRGEETGEPAEEPAPEHPAPVEANNAPAPDEPSAEEAARVVEEATAAAAAAETGSTYCESAHGGLVAMVARVAESYPDRTLAAPERAAFLEVCESLPEDVQRCLLPSHATAHQSECAAASAALSAEDAQRLEAVLRPGS